MTGGTPEQMAAAVEEFRDENSGDPSVTCQSVKDANLRTCLHFAAVHGNGPTCGYIFKFCGKYVFILACSILSSMGLVVERGRLVGARNGAFVTLLCSTNVLFDSSWPVCKHTISPSLTHGLEPTISKTHRHRSRPSALQPFSKCPCAFRSPHLPPLCYSPFMSPSMTLP